MKQKVIRHSLTTLVDIDPPHMGSPFASHYYNQRQLNLITLTLNEQKLYWQWKCLQNEQRYRRLHLSFFLNIWLQ